MQKIVRIALLVSFLSYGIYSPSETIAGWSPSMDSPAYGPEGRPVEDLQEYSKPNQMFNILPGRPIAARDKYGNRLYFAPNGKMTLKVAQDGKMTFSFQDKSIETDLQGNILKQSDLNPDTKLVEIKNDKGQIIGYQELGFGNQVIKEFDHQKNLTKTNVYDKYGKNIEHIINELTLGKTVFDNQGKPAYDINYEGNQIAWYHYDDNGRLTLKTDLAKNKTYYDKNGNMTYTENFASDVVMKYAYIKDDEGRFLLNTSVDIYGNVTYYNDGKAQIEKSGDGQITLKEYVYDGRTLQYVFDHTTKEVTWYDIAGKELYSTIDGGLAREWIYSKGKLVALWDERDDSVIAFIRGEEVARYYVSTKPTPELVQELIDRGFIEKQYAVQ